VCLAILCLAFAACLWPPLIEQSVSLDWQIGDMRQVAHAAQLLFAAVALALFVFRRRADAWLKRRIPSGKHIAPRLFLTTVSVVLCAVAAEFALRALRDPLRPLWDPPESGRAQYDAVLGWTYLPGQSVTQSFVRGLPPVAVHTDKNGIRVPSSEAQLDRERPAVLFVGGSYTMGYGLAYEDTFAGRLAANPDFPYQVVNLGVEAYGTDQAWLRLQRYLHGFNTVAVVLTFLPAHVDRNLTGDLRIIHRGVRMVGTKPLFGVRRDGSVYLKRSPSRLEDYRCSRLWALLQRTWIERGPRKRSLRLTRALIEAMGREVEKAGAVMVLVLWDFWGDGSHTRPMLEGTGFSLIDLCAEHPEGWSEMRLPNDSHPNAEACGYAATRLMTRFRELGLIAE